MRIEFFFLIPRRVLFWCLYLFCHMSTLVELIFQNSTNTCSPKKTWLCRLLHWNHVCIWVLSYHSYVMKRYFPALSYSVITTSLILPNCSPASINILPPFSGAAFPFQVMPQPPASLQSSSLALALPAPSKKCHRTFYPWWMYLDSLVRPSCQFCCVLKKILHYPASSSAVYTAQAVI